MASIIRPTLLRQARTIAPTQSSRIASAALKPLSRQSAILPSATRVAAFHVSGRRPILPAEPQKIEGGVNDAVTFPEPHPTHGSYHWTAERLISVGLVPLTIAPFAAGSLNPVMDATLCAMILVHSHIGFQSVIIDYLPQRRVPGIRRLFWWGLNAATLLVGVGLYEFETNDVGLTEAIKRIWKA